MKIKVPVNDILAIIITILATFGLFFLIMYLTSVFGCTDYSMLGMCRGVGAIFLFFPLAMLVPLVVAAAISYFFVYKKLIRFLNKIHPVKDVSKNYSKLIKKSSMFWGTIMGGLSFFIISMATGEFWNNFATDNNLLMIIILLILSTIVLISLWTIIIDKIFNK